MPGKFSRSIILIIIILTALVIYSNTFSSSFHLDDLIIIEDYDKIQSLANYLDFSGTRYVGELSFALNYHFGRLNVFGYHVVNIVIHIINGLLVWLLAGLTLRTPVMERFKMDSRTRWFIALAASLIFIAHPVQTQAVTYIVQRFASLATLFYLMSLVLYVKWRLSRGGRIDLIYYILSIFSAVLAMKTKEISFTLPFVIILYEYLFFKEKRKNYIYLIPFILTLLIIPLTILGTHIPAGGGGEAITGGLREATRETDVISRGDYLLTQFRVIATYIRLLFLPVNQNLDYDYPVSRSLFDPGVFLSFLFLLIIFAAAVFLFIRSRKTGNGYMLLISFGIVWFFLTLSVESGIIPINDVIFEHRLYLPSAGAALAFSTAIAWIVESIRGRLRLKISSLTVIVLILIVAPLSIASYQRNRVWKDEVTLWEDVVSKSPRKARVHAHLGTVYYKLRRKEKAIEEFMKALAIKPDLSVAYSGLGLVYYREGLMDAAIAQYREAIRINPDIAEFHYNLGDAYHRQDRFDESVIEYMTAIRLKPDFAEAYNNLGLTYYKQDRLEDAIGQYMTAIRLKPAYAKAHYNLGLAYRRQGRTREAREEFMTALNQNPALARSFSNIDLSTKD